MSQQLFQNVQKIREQEHVIFAQVRHFLQASSRSVDGVMHMAKDISPTLPEEHRKHIESCMSLLDPLQKYLKSVSNDDHIFLDKQGNLTEASKEIIRLTKDAHTNILSKKEEILKSSSQSEEFGKVHAVLDKHIVKELRVLMNYISVSAAYHVNSIQEQWMDPKSSSVHVQTGSVVPTLGHELYSSNAHLIKLDKNNSDQIVGIMRTQHPSLHQSKNLLHGLWLRLVPQQTAYTKSLQSVDVMDGFLAAVAKDEKFGSGKLYFQLMNPSLQHPHLSAPLLVQGLGGMICALLEWRMEKQIHEMVQNIYLGAQGAFGPRFNPDNFVFLDEKGKVMSASFTRAIFKHAEQLFNQQYVIATDFPKEKKSYFTHLSDTIIHKFKDIFYPSSHKEAISPISKLSS